MKLKSSLISIAVAGLLVACGGSSDSKDGNSTDVGGANGNGGSTSVTVPSGAKNVLEAKTLNYESNIKTWAKKNFEGKSLKDTIEDNKIKRISTNKDGTKVAVTSVYHNALTIFDENGKATISSFGTLKKAGNRVDANGEAFQTVPDTRTGASENYLTDVKFSSNGEYVYLNLRPKYLGEGTFHKKKKFYFNPNDDYGLYKAKISAENTVNQATATKFGEKIFNFTLLENGNLVAKKENGSLVVLNKDLQEVANKNIENLEAFATSNNQLFVLLKENNNYFIQELNLTDLSDKSEKISYSKNNTEDAEFNVSLDGKKAIISNEDSICLTNLVSKQINCADGDTDGLASLSPNGKFIAFKSGTIANIQNDTPAITGKIELGGSKIYAIDFVKDDKLIMAIDKKDIKILNISADGKVEK